MAKKKGRTKAIVRRVVTTARTSGAKAKEVAEKSQRLMTPAAGASVAAGAALGSVVGARIVSSGYLTPKQTGGALIVAGSATTYVGYRQESPIIFGAGIGTGVAGVSLIVNTMVIEGEERKVRNASHVPLPDNEREESEEQDAVLH